MSHTCPLCGNVRFATFEGYKAHRMQWHGIHEITEIPKPVNTSGRTKAQIVQEAEDSWLKPFILEGNAGKHLEACRCEVCKASSKA